MKLAAVETVAEESSASEGQSDSAAKKIIGARKYLRRVVWRVSLIRRVFWANPFLHLAVVVALSIGTSCSAV
jgi:hypothetical protein